ncbi:MAG: quinolinate synthase NadA [Bacteroidales bacterium]|nr:quinolinate synthase NadA [Bacteroidales bacterium]
MSETNLIEKINNIRKEKNAIILAHYYQVPEIQDIADFIGDSLQLSQQASNTQADIILFAGVYFMAETAKILNPKKKVIIPDKNAGCSLADSINASDFNKFLQNYPNHIVVTYINTSAEIKAMSDIICTSSNAVRIIESIPKDKKIVFAPDKNLGNYIKKITGRDMVIWDGACHVHEEFSLERILELKNQYREAKIISHPECKEPILIVSDFVGSTSALLNFVKNDTSKIYIVATETGILHQMKKAMPEKLFIPAPPIDSTCGCNDCKYMKLNTLEKIYFSLKNEQFEVTLPEEIIEKAYRPIKRMLDLS